MNAGITDAIEKRCRRSCIVSVPRALVARLYPSVGLADWLDTGTPFPLNPVDAAFKSFRNSAAVWYRASTFFSNAFNVTRSSAGVTAGFIFEGGGGVT